MIEITDFVPYEQIDPIYFAHTYYVGRKRSGEGLLAACEGDGGLGPGRDREVRDARSPVSRGAAGA